MLYCANKSCNFSQSVIDMNMYNLYYCIGNW